MMMSTIATHLNTLSELMMRIDYLSKANAKEHGSSASFLTHHSLFHDHQNLMVLVHHACTDAHLCRWRVSCWLSEDAMGYWVVGVDIGQ